MNEAFRILNLILLAVCLLQPWFIFGILTVYRFEDGFQFNDGIFTLCNIAGAWIMTRLMWAGRDMLLKEEL